MKKTLLSTISILAALASQAQLSNFEDLSRKNAETKNIDTVAWIHTGALTIGANEGILHNWAAGGELASLTLNGTFDGSLTRYNHRTIWTNNLNATYGLFYAYSNAFIPRKTDDRIDLTSKFGYQLKPNSNFFFTGLFNAKTQFTKAYDYNVPNWDTFTTSKFFSPLYLTLAPGIEFRQGSQLSIFLSPLAVRATFVDEYYTLRNPEGAFGIDYGETFRMELGAYLSARFVKELSKHVSYRTRLDLYSNYLAKDSYVNNILVKKDNPGNIDLLWDNFLTFKFARYFSINIGLTAIYDNDVPYEQTFTDANGIIRDKDEPYSGLGWWQIKQIMNVGFNFKF